MTHEFLISKGYLYLGESCGCNGKPKAKRYVKDRTTVRVLTSQNRYYLESDRIKKNIDEIYTDTAI